VKRPARYREVEAAHGRDGAESLGDAPDFDGGADTHGDRCQQVGKSVASRSSIYYGRSPLPGHPSEASEYSERHRNNPAQRPGVIAALPARAPHNRARRPAGLRTPRDMPRSAALPRRCLYQQTLFVLSRGLSRPVEPPARLPSSNFNPDLSPPDLAPKSMNRLARHRRAPPVRKSEPPSVQRAEHLIIFDPAMPERSALVRTPARERRDCASMAKHGHAQPGCVARSTSSLRNLVQSANSDPLGHARSSFARVNRIVETKNLGLASEAIHSLDSKGNAIVLQNVNVI
jgi:hypothetical protein